MNLGHERKQLGDVVGLCIPGEFPVQSRNIHHDSLGITPAVVVVKRDVEGCIEYRHVGVESFARFVAYVDEITPHRPHTVLVGDGTVAGHDRFDVESEHVIACIDPILYRSCPENGMPFNEEDIAGEYQAVGRNVGQYVPGCVCRAYLLEMNQLSSRYVCPLSAVAGVAAILGAPLLLSHTYSRRETRRIAEAKES